MGSILSGHTSAWYTPPQATIDRRIVKNTDAVNAIREVRPLVFS